MNKGQYALLFLISILLLNTALANDSYPSEEYVSFLPSEKTENIDIELVFVGYDSEYVNEEVLNTHLTQNVNPFVFLETSIPHST